MKKILSLLILLPFLVSAQEKGIHFEHGATWAQIQAKAKAENKYIFVDCFTTWCGPCKKMSETVFPLEEVGNYFNSRFISVKVQIDSTAEDNDEVKKWYDDALTIELLGSVQAYPTYLFFAPDGTLAHRAVGASDAKTFLSKAEAATNPDKQYYVLLAKYNEGQKTPDLLKKAALAATKASDLQSAQKIADEYIASLKAPYTKDDIDFLDKFTNSSKDKGFSVFLNNEKKIDSTVPGIAHAKILSTILEEEVPTTLMKKTNPDWKAAQTAIAIKYPKYATEVISLVKVIYCGNKENWSDLYKALVIHRKKYGSITGARLQYELARLTFYTSPDSSCLKEALEWSKLSIAGNSNPKYIDMYANLLYKTGNKKDALKWSEKAVALAEEDDKKVYQKTLDKINAGK